MKTYPGMKIQGGLMGEKMISGEGTYSWREEIYAAKVGQLRSDKRLINGEEVVIVSVEG